MAYIAENCDARVLVVSDEMRDAGREFDWAFVNLNLRPYYAEGSKTIAFETAEQLGWRAPDHVVVPVASGALLTRIGHAFRQLHAVGLLDDEPHVRVSGAQGEGCAPVADAFAAGADQVKPVRYPETIAKSLAIGDPADGFHALEEVRRSGGAMASVSDEEIVEAVGLLARTEGVFTETAGGVPIGVLSKLAARGVVRPDERVVAYVTGLGLKTLEPFAGAFGVAASIQPTAVGKRAEVVVRPLSSALRIRYWTVFLCSISCSAVVL